MEDPERKKALLSELGNICATVLVDKERAISAYQAQRELEPDSLDALRNLEPLLSGMGRTQEVVEVLGALVELGNSNPELIEDYIKLANAQMEIDELEEAFKSFRAVLLKKRDHEGAIEGLEGLIQRAENKVDIAQVLEPIYTSRQDHERLAWVLEQRLEGTEDPVQRKGLLRRIGDVYENRLEQKDRAFVMARRSLAEDPSDMGVRMWIEKLAGETGTQDALALAYVEEAERAEITLKTQFLRRAASIYHEKLADVAAAAVQYNAILELEERDEKSLTGLEQIYRSQENFTELVNILQRRLSMSAGIERKREYLNEIASLQAQQLGDHGAAVATYRQLLEIAPDDPAPFAAIEKLLSESAQWEELARAYQLEEERLAEKRGRDVAARRLELTHRRAVVMDEQFGDPTAAVEIFDGVLKEDHERPRTLEYLNQRAQTGQQEFVALLERFFQEHEQWQNYAQLLETKLTHTAENQARREIYVELSKCYDEHLNVGDLSFQALTRAYNENRADIELLDLLEATAERHNQWAELVAVLGVDLDAVPDADLRQNLLRRLGDICGNRLDDTERAIAYLQQALQYRPDDKEALASLDAIFEKKEMWAALGDLLERRVEVAQEPSEKSVLLERLASVWGDRLMDAEAALRCHQQILEIDPDHPISLTSMEKLYAEVEDWDALAKNLTRQTEVLTDPENLVRINAAAGELYAEELGDMGAAIDHWQAVVAIEPAHEMANQALDVLLAAEERWEEFAEHLQRRLSHTRDAAQKLEINRRLGVILGEKLGRGEDALGSWIDVLQQDPKNLDAIRALLELYDERAMWDDFVSMAKRLIPLAEPPEAKDVRYRLARVYGENLGQVDKAIKLAREVRAQEPHTDEEMARLAVTLSNIEAFEEAVVALEKAAALTEEPETKVARYYEAAGVHAEKLGKPNDAREAFEAILAVRPDDPNAYTSLAEIYRDTEEWRQLIALHESFLPHAAADARLDMLTEVRDVQDQKLGEKELAFIAACRVYKENPEDLGAAEIVERIAAGNRRCRRGCGCFGGRS